MKVCLQCISLRIALLMKIKESIVSMPEKMNGFAVESVRSSTTGQLHVFVYDEENFHIDNIRKLNIMNTEEIFSKHR